MTTTLPQIADATLLTHSRLSCLRTCARKHQLRYELGIRRGVEAKPLRLGAAVHLGLDAWYSGAEQSAAVLRAVAGYAEVPAWATTPEQIEEWMLEREIVARLLTGYFWRWGTPAPGSVVASELEFSLPLRNPETGAKTPLFQFAGKIDKVVRLDDGRLAVMEHKTCGEDLSTDSDYWRRLRIDGQISGYYLAARELGHDIQTVLYDVIRKPSIRPRKLTKEEKTALGSFGKYAGEDFNIEIPERETVEMFGARLSQDISERPEFYYARQEIPRLESDLEEFRWELWQQQQTLRESQRHGRWPRNTGACLVMGRCEYFDLCTGGWTPEATLPSAYTRVEKTSPELSIVE